MARVWVFQCSEGRVTYTVTLSQNQYGACANAKGSWIEIDSVAPFDPSQLDPVELAEAWAAGFVVVGVGLVLAIPFRLLLKAIRSF